MTREEILNEIANDKTMPFIRPEQLAGIVDFVIKNYVPSVPNLDEAAENYAHSLGYDDEEDKAEIAGAKEDFIAGAEWMEGQGASFNTKVGWIDGPTILDWPDDILDGFEMGDEAIVQIRKK